MAPNRATAWDELASQCERAVALIVAGISPNQVRSTVLAQQKPIHPDVGADVELLDAAWQSSVDTGAPLSVTVKMCAQTYRALAAIDREVSAAVAGPKMAARVMLTLPAIGVLIAAALGLNVLIFFVSHALGVLCFVGGMALLWAGWWWSRALIRRVTTESVPRGVVPSVVVAGLRAGVGVHASLEALSQHLSIEQVASDATHLHRARKLSEEWGAPLADVVHAETLQRRDAEIAQVRKQCAELSEKIVLPLGTCVLPAFILLAVVPLVVELISTSGIVSGV